MGLIAVVKNVLKATRQAAVHDVEVDLGGNELATAEAFAPTGEDSVPLVGDLAYVAGRSGQGRGVLLGHIDPDNEQLAEEGERRMYSRSSDRRRVAQVWVKNTGEVTVENDNGYFTLRPDGTVDANTATIDPQGNITSPGTVKAQKFEGPSAVIGGKEINNHNHNITSGSSAGVTAVNN